MTLTSTPPAAAATLPEMPSGRRLRIAVWHNLPSGGGKRALDDHVRGLLRRGHYVEAWCPPTANRDFLPLRDLVTEHVVPLNWSGAFPAVAAGGSQPQWGAPGALRRFNQAFHEHGRACAQAINQGGFDVVFANSCLLNAAAPLGQYLTLPKVLFLQEPRRWLYEVLPPITRMPWLDVKLWGRYWWTPTRIRHYLAEQIRIHCLRVTAREEHDNIWAYDEVLVNSRFSRENLLRTFGRDSRVCYLGVDTERFQPVDVPREDTVVGLGAVGSQKNLELAIRAVGAIPVPRPPLIWAGNVSDAGYEGQMQALAVQCGVDFRVVCLTQTEQVTDFLSRCGVMLYTSRLEPLGLAPLEANACGAPVVAAAEGGIRETVVDGTNGLLCDPTPEALGAAVQRLRQDPDLARRLGVSGRQWVVDHWGVDAAVDAVEQRLLAAAGVPGCV